jgi:hypothetical protein
MIHLVRFLFEHDALVILMGAVLTVAPITGIMIAHSKKHQ